MEITEQFLNQFFIWLFIGLGLGTGVTISFILWKHKAEPPVSRTVKRGTKQNAASHKTVKPLSKKASAAGEVRKSSFEEKLGQLVVNSMIIISHSEDIEEVNKYLMIIRGECERLNGMKLPEENKKIISTVFLWANRFDAERHVGELKLFRKSSQIQYDSAKRDFKLMISGG